RCCADARPARIRAGRSRSAEVVARGLQNREDAGSNPVGCVRPLPEGRSPRARKYRERPAPLLVTSPACLLRRARPPVPQCPGPPATAGPLPVTLHLLAV